MARKRLLVETNEYVRSALLSTVDTQGISLAHWLEDQVTTTVPGAFRALPDDFTELHDWNLADDPARALAELDWAFTHYDTGYLTHDLHPYPAKFIPQIPANLISRLSVRGDLVLDPFGGSATTAVEAVRLGRRAVSVDANPLSSLIGRVKTGLMTPAVRADLEQLTAAIVGQASGIEARGTTGSDALISRYRRYVPDIPNHEKWFSDAATGELALLRFLIDETTSDLSRDAALLVLSRIVIRVSYQDSETRYVAAPKMIGPGFTLRSFLESLKTVIRRLENAAVDLQYADARFLTGDSRTDLVTNLGENSVDLIVTSPPYPNATDYHLYHRFRLFWLGFDPRALGRIEIGSHLRHQRNQTGFEEYSRDMTLALEGCERVLQPGRYAVFVVGDGLFKGEFFSTADAISDAGRAAGLVVLERIERPLHRTKRSFTQAARRARLEQLIVLQKPNRSVTVFLNPPAYRMWPFEEKLRTLEIKALTDATVDVAEAAQPVRLNLSQPALWNARRLTYTKDLSFAASGGPLHSTWQRVLENGDGQPGRRGRIRRSANTTPSCTS